MSMLQPLSASSEVLNSEVAVFLSDSELFRNYWFKYLELGILLPLEIQEKNYVQKTAS